MYLQQFMVEMALYTVYVKENTECRHQVTFKISMMIYPDEDCRNTLTYPGSNNSGYSAPECIIFFVLFITYLIFEEQPVFLFNFFTLDNLCSFFLQYLN